MSGRAPRILSVGLLILLLTGCGWHLRGTLPGQPSLDSVEVALDTRVGTGDLYREVRNALQASGAEVVSPREGVPVLVLRSERRQNRRISGGRTTDIQEYELRFEVDWELLDGDGEPLVERTTFRQFRNYRFDQSQVLGSEGQEDVLVTELQRDAAMLIRERVQATVGRID